MPKRKYHLGAGDLILNSPFEEPAAYWSYDREHRIFTQVEGRRPAGYIVATSSNKSSIFIKETSVTGTGESKV